MGDIKVSYERYRQLVDVDKLDEVTDKIVNLTVDGEIAMNEELESVLSIARDESNNIFMHDEIVDSIIESIKSFNKHENMQYLPIISLIKNIVTVNFGSIAEAIVEYDKQARFNANLSKLIKAFDEAGIFS
ncbi:MAG: hypothetical protein OWR52_04115 [Acidibacillus sp.]|nr:hypothetical protein [Acidibacillus sp.]